MKLIDAIHEISSLEHRIYKDGGELSELTEQELANAEKELSNHTDSVVFAYERRKTEVKMLKEAVKAHIKSKEKRLERFKDTIKYCLEKKGSNLETPVTYVKMRETKSQEVLIWDFDTVIDNVPEALTIEVKDNVKKLTLSKTILKGWWNTNDLLREGCGFEVKDKVTTWPDIRVRGKKNAVIHIDC